MKTIIKRQTRKIGVAGGIINQIEGNNSTLPVVGEGATELHYSDRSPYEVLWVSEDGMSCKIRRMNSKRTDNNGISESQSYEYTSNTEANIELIEWNNKKQCWGRITYSIEIIRALWKRALKTNDVYDKGFDDKKLFNGHSYNDVTYWKNENDFRKSVKLVDGVTKMYKNFNSISILFGSMEEYIDPCF
jgi:hypothetical protein